MKIKKKKSAAISLKPYTTSQKNFQRYEKELSVIISKRDNKKGLPSAQEISLAGKIKQGDQVALQELVQANLTFVIQVAKEYQDQGLPLEDLISTGNLGLIKAAQRFDGTRGFKFISYAVWWIRQSILLALSNESRVIRIPVSRIGKIIKVGQALENLSNQFNREPTIRELASHTRLTPGQVEESLINFFNPFLSLDKPIKLDGEENNLLAILSETRFETPDQSVLKESLHHEIIRALSTLNKREAEIIKLHFGIDQEIPLSFDDIGDRMSLTRESIRQIYEKGMRRLRKKPNLKFLEIYLE